MYVLYSTLLHMPLSDSTVSENAGIEPRKVATKALAVRRSCHSATSHPPISLYDLLWREPSAGGIRLPERDSEEPVPG